MSDPIRRPGTRYILTKVTSEGAVSSLEECATIVDIYTALRRWYPGITPTAVFGILPPKVDFFNENQLLAVMREVFE